MLWAINNRVDWSQDIFLVPGSQGHEMDPTADTRGVQTKIGIDATYKPERRPYGKRIVYPDVGKSVYILRGGLEVFLNSSLVRRWYPIIIPIDERWYEKQ